MKPRDINKLIASEIFGYEVKDDNIIKEGRYRVGIPLYSQNIESAWQVVEKLEYDVKVTKTDLKPKYQVHVFVPGGVKMVFAETAPMAICKGALASVGIELQD
ncbi:hypothetical protein P5815_21935 [Bacillus cereus]|uniref:BC1872 family protein n=1 Tax=Bacillus cereus TaxID=1396 RepID=UPI002405F770|nr:hypothetical protein [Bacillus cereus]MDF9523192.1 hypothetical protein [Bacillus cereus]MDF9561888.1 hypothetical protein [Bacillus cereus]